MANTKDFFIIGLLLSCVGNVISATQKDREDMIRPNTFESVLEMVERKVAEMVTTKVVDVIETRVAEMVDIRVAEMVETKVSEMMETRVAEMVDIRVAELVKTKVSELVETRVSEMVDSRVAQDMSQLKDEIKKEVAFDNTGIEDSVVVNKGENFNKNEDLRHHLKDELMAEVNQSISLAVPRAVRDLPYLVTCAYQVHPAPYLIIVSYISYDVGVKFFK